MDKISISRLLSSLTIEERALIMCEIMKIDQYDIGSKYFK